MRKNATIKESLVHITGPLGPTVSFEKRGEDQESWLAHLKERHLRELEIILMEASDKLLTQGMDAEEARALAAEGVVSLIDEESEDHLEILQRLIRHSESEVSVIDALGDAEADMVVPLLTSRVDEYAMPAVLVAIAGSLGSVGGAEADEILTQMLKKFSHLDEVREEIEGCLGMF